MGWIKKFGKATKAVVLSPITVTKATVKKAKRGKSKAKDNVAMNRLDSSLKDYNKALRCYSQAKRKGVTGHRLSKLFAEVAEARAKLDEKACKVSSREEKMIDRKKWKRATRAQKKIDLYSAATA